jgi:hypothetical protein
VIPGVTASSGSEAGLGVLNDVIQDKDTRHSFPSTPQVFVSTVDWAAGTVARPTGFVLIV